ncbi:hypothetical protein GT347_10625 [Xylophilus rhododendri]|uniref:Uncharacterized protein n=1 Tax=Xylophilus rhododendri TaxID=2697032 RepID=A0A857J6J1_9BURK|nr:hypothetical protein [Xylophilus rhododendri]QHI98408.1 hypothetical protein GT347_10625 [Xylophilus rhododendri]
MPLIPSRMPAALTLLACAALTACGGGNDPVIVGGGGSTVQPVSTTLAPWPAAPAIPAP